MLPIARTKLTPPTRVLVIARLDGELLRELDKDLGPDPRQA